jgi:hypothetical protein
MSCGSAPSSGPRPQVTRRACEGLDDRASPRGVRDAVARACEGGAVLAQQLRIAVLTRMRRRERTRKLLGGCRRGHQGGRHDQADQHESESHFCSLPRRPVGAGRRVFVGVPSRTSSEPLPSPSLSRTTSCCGPGTRNATVTIGSASAKRRGVPEQAGRAEPVQARAARTPSAQPGMSKLLSHRAEGIAARLAASRKRRASATVECCVCAEAPTMPVTAAFHATRERGPSVPSVAAAQSGVAADSASSRRVQPTLTVWPARGHSALRRPDAGAYRAGARRWRLGRRGEVRRNTPPAGRDSLRDELDLCQAVATYRRVHQALVELGQLVTNLADSLAGVS